MDAAGGQQLAASATRKGTYTRKRHATIKGSPIVSESKHEKLYVLTKNRLRAGIGTLLS